MRRVFLGIAMLLALTASATSQELVSPQSNLNELYLRQWVTAPSGVVTGSVSETQAAGPISLGGVRVSLLRNGIVAHVADSNAQGQFSFAGVAPGDYSLVAQSADAMSAFSLKVVSPAHGKHLGNNVEVRCIRPVSNRVTEIIRSHFMPSVGVSHVVSDFDPLAATRTFSDSHSVSADEAGNLNGRVGSVFGGGGRDMRGTMVYILRDGGEVARTTCSHDGTFRVTGLKSGVYNFVAAGPVGFAALSFNFVNPYIAQASVAKKGYVNASAVNASSLNVELSANVEPEVVPVMDEVVVDTVPPPAYGVGGWGGGSFGGGGSGGGGSMGGMGGGLIGLAGLAGIAAVIASEDDDFNPVPITSG